jgi:F-type H+-transporting ATPase subunit b
VDNLLTINPGLVFWTIVSFVLLVAILKRLAWGPILAALEHREKSIKDAVLGAEAARKEAERLLAEQKALAARAEADAEATREKAARGAEARAAEMYAEARAKAEALLEHARQEIEREEARAIGSLRKEAADLAIGAASRLLGRSVDSSDNRRLVDEFIRDVDKKEIG